MAAKHKVQPNGWGDQKCSILHNVITQTLKNKKEKKIKIKNEKYELCLNHPLERTLVAPGIMKKRRRKKDRWLRLSAWREGAEPEDVKKPTRNWAQGRIVWRKLFINALDRRASEQSRARQRGRGRGVLKVRGAGVRRSGWRCKVEPHARSNPREPPDRAEPEETEQCSNCGPG